MAQGVWSYFPGYTAIQGNSSKRTVPMSVGVDLRYYVTIAELNYFLHIRLITYFFLSVTYLRDPIRC